MCNTCKKTNADLAEGNTLEEQKKARAPQLVIRRERANKRPQEGLVATSRQPRASSQQRAREDAPLRKTAAPSEAPATQHSSKMSDRPQGGGGKRRNTNAQQRREEAEAEDDEVVEAGTFQRASQEKLRKRRIVSVSGRFKSRSTPQMQAPPALSSGTQPTVGAKPKQGCRRDGGHRGRRQGRGHLRERQADGAAAGAGPEVFRIELSEAGGGNPARLVHQCPGARADGTIISLRRRLVLPRVADVFLSPMAETPVVSKSSADKMEACNRAFLKWVRRQAQNKPATPWTAGVRDYLAHVAKPRAARPGAAPSAPAASKPFAFPAAPAPAAGCKAVQLRRARARRHRKPAFNFGAPPPKADAPKPAFSFGAAPPSTSAFNFGGAAPAPAAKEDDAMPKEERVAVAKADDGDETTAFESRCALRRYDKPEGEKPQWRDLGKGQLRVTRHKTTGAARVVVRNDVGKVVLNFSLSEKMSLVKTATGVGCTAQLQTGGGLAGRAKQSCWRTAKLERRRVIAPFRRRRSSRPISDRNPLESRKRYFAIFVVGLDGRGKPVFSWLISILPRLSSHVAGRSPPGAAHQHGRRQHLQGLRHGLQGELLRHLQGGQ